MSRMAETSADRVGVTPSASIVWTAVAKEESILSKTSSALICETKGPGKATTAWSVRGLGSEAFERQWTDWA